MKVLSFAGYDEIYLKYILPALLNKTKTQTIRPAWNDAVKHKWSLTRDNCAYEKIKYVSGKPPRFQVGETFILEWKSRSSPRGSWFCSNCGMLEKIRNPSGKCDHLYFPENTNPTAFKFPKILGMATITEVLKMEMRKTPHGKFFGLWLRDGDIYLTTEEYEELAKKDGFPDAETMFKWFDNKYDLSVPRMFWVYRWKGAGDESPSHGNFTTIIPKSMTETFI